MYRFFKAVILGLCLTSLNAMADAKSDLKDKLSRFDAMSADFTQTVNGKLGEVVSTTKGTIALKKPDSLMMHTMEPDEQVLFTKNKEVYFFDPFINQVSIFDKKDLFTSPFMLLTSRDNSVWKQYEVVFSGSEYRLTPSQKADVKSISVKFSGNDVKKLSISLKDGNVNHYEFTNISHNVDNDDFFYHIPEDAQIDDERKSN